MDSFGRVLSTGNNRYGELGRQGRTDRFALMQGAPGTITKIFAGNGVSFITDINSKLYSFGSNRLSLQDENTHVPTSIEKFKHSVSQVDCGMTFIMAVTTSH